MKANLSKVLGIATILGIAGASVAQPGDWDRECIDPANTTPFSNPFLFNQVSNPLISASMGFGGTVQYGSTDPDNGIECYGTALTLANNFRFAFAVGNVGSVQQSSDNFNDNGLALTVGAPSTPVGTYTYANLLKDGTASFIGANGISEAFRGFSNRYMSQTTTNDGIRIKCVVECVADVIRMRWIMTNTGTETASIGLRFGATLGMLTGNGATSNSESGSASSSHYLGQKAGYVWLPTGRPPNTDVKYDRALRPNDFPSYVDFVFGQTDYFGMRIENLPSAATLDPNPNNAPTEATKITLGKASFLMGAPDAANPIMNPDALLPDTVFLGSTAFVQEFPEQQVAAGSTRQILHYIRSTWGEGNYFLPYGVVVDAPRLIATRATDFNGNQSDGGIVPNPFTVRTYVDNVGGFGTGGTEFDLESVKVTLDIDPKYDVAVQGSTERTIPKVLARQLRFTDFTVKAGPNANGDVPYTITVKSQPGNVTKVINGKITIAARPRITLKDDVNFVTTPFIFGDSSWEAILANFLDPNVPGAEAQVFAFDPQQQGYVPALAAERGRSAWIVYKKGTSGPITADLGGQPTTPATFLQGANALQLRTGWNQIGNPYNYSFPISQMVGVSASNPSQSYIWADLVSLGYVSNFLAEYDPETGDYNYIDGREGLMEPNKGYWVNVLDPNDVSLGYPPLFAGWTPNQPRTAGGRVTPTKARAWTQSANQWRLKLTARTSEDIDAENYIGLAASAKDANALRVFEPPMAPMKNLGLSVEETVGVKQTRIAQSLQVKGGRKEFKVMVDVRKAGSVSLNWPNLATVPSNLRFHITDVATGTTRDLRRTSGYTFTADKTGTREFKVSVEEGGASRAVIGNVVISQPGRSTDKSAPITVNYTLSSDATTSVRILAANGREVYTASRGRADRAGENTITWTLRDKANRAVAPGAYRVEIVAETTGGERVRKVIPVNVIR